ncbi:MAG: diaminopimelate epimerase [Oscillospiraceae bacterium]|nr:diaminopimelate epimerase [Oscillospiraceae bacterium]
MRFWKMNGAGNDFIILNNLEERLSETEFPMISRTLCERHTSLGADGLMVIEKPLRDGDFRMLFYNSDGSLGEMCGNGARCVCRYGYETGLAGARQTVETTAGNVTGERIDKRSYRVRLNNPTVLDLERVLEIDGREWRCAYAELGNPGLPHAVVEYPGLRGADENALRELGRALRWNAAFPKGANVNFYERTGPDAFYERTFERGVEDFTYACGTGTASVAAVLTLKGAASGKRIRADMTGGTLYMDVERDGDQITGLYLTGPTNIVAKGEICDETLFP